MRRRNRLFSHALRALACLLVLAMLQVPVVMAQQEDPAATEPSAKSSIDAPPKAKAKKKIKKKKAAAPAKQAQLANPVSSNELMNSMRQSLLQPASAPPPPSPSSAPVSAPPSAAPPSVSPSSASLAAPPPQSPAMSAPPASYTSTGPAPVLSEMDEPPSIMGGGPLAAPPPQQSQAPTAMPESQETGATPNYSPSRPLFGKKGGKKRIGVVAKAKVTPVAAPMSEPILTPKKTEAPPSPPAEKSEPAKPAETPAASGTTNAPTAASSDGAVVYSQSAGEKAKASAVSEAPAKSGPAPATQETSDALLVPDNSAAPAVKSAPAASTASAAAAPVLAAAPVPETHSSLHASCGAANGVGSPAKPTTNLCTEGKPSEVSGKGPWRWTCKGEKGRASVSCAAPLLVNGECGLASGSQSASAPLPKQLCASGKASEMSGGGPWYWTCIGENGGVVAQCATYTLIKGACGPASGAVAESAPASGLCNSGRETPVMGDGPWTWTCAGSGEGMTANCMAMARRDGLCGPASDAGAIERPSANLCASGKPTAVTGDGPWNWMCSGENGGSSASCSAPVVHDSACGPAHGVGALAAPMEGLCSEGRASEVGGDGPWYWTCYGDNGGARVNCMAPRKLDGECGIASHMETEKVPSSDLCASGTPGAVMGSGPWRWTCQGAGGGVTNNCMAQRPAQAACGMAQGVASPVPPVTGLCAAGTSTSVIGSGPWLWSCEGPQHTQVVNCMAPLQVNGACGNASDIPVSRPPSSGLCSTGLPSPISGEGPWAWTCQGSGGGTSIACHTMNAEIAPPPAPPPPPPAPTASPVAEVPPDTAGAGNECTPTVRRWTITCQQGGYPANYAGVIVGETQVLCPTGVERGVWLSNSCAPSSNSVPISPSPGVMVKPPSPRLSPVTDVLPDIEPLPAGKLQPSAPRLSTPRFKNAAADTSVNFMPGADGLDVNATHALDEVAAQTLGRGGSIVTLNAYAAMPASNEAQDAQRLSLARALAVRGYLMSHGVANNQIDIHALGPAGDSLGDDRVDIKISSP